MGLEKKAAKFTAQSGIPLSYIITLDEDYAGNLPTGNVAVSYANKIKVAHRVPVTVDPTAEVILKATPYDAAARPGKCVLTPEMKLLYCYVGSDDTKAFAAIVADAAK